MAKDVEKNKPEEAAEGGKEKKKGSKLKWIIIGVVLVLVLGGGAGAYFFLFSDSDAPKAQGAAAFVPPTPPQVAFFDVPDILVNDACIMLCPVGDYLSVTGEDLTNGPFGSSYWSETCTCQHPFPSENLMIWADLGGATADSPTSWGKIRTLYR